MMEWSDCGGRENSVLFEEGDSLAKIRELWADHGPSQIELGLTPQSEGNLG